MLIRLFIVACQLGEGVSMILGDTLWYTDQACWDCLQVQLSSFRFDSLSFKFGVHHLTYIDCKLCPVAKASLRDFGPHLDLGMRNGGHPR